MATATADLTTVTEVTVTEGDTTPTPSDAPTSAPAPTRATGSLTIGWNLISIPVSVYAGTEDGGVQRSEYVEVTYDIGDGTGPKADFIKAGRVPYYTDPATGEQVTVDYTQIVKRFECQDGAYVSLSDAEIAHAVGATNGEAKILAFQPKALLGEGTYVIDSLMQVRPAKRGSGRDKNVDPVAQRAFALLTKAMTDTGTFALVQYVLRGKVRYAALTDDGRFYGLRFAGEVRESLPLPAVALTDPEVAAATMLVTTGIDPEPRVLTDDASAKVKAYANGKARTGHAPTEAPDAPTGSESFSDLMEKLVASVAAAGGVPSKGVA